jgi:hypothetical protein
VLFSKDWKLFYRILSRVESPGNQNPISRENAFGFDSELGQLSAVRWGWLRRRSMATGWIWSLYAQRIEVSLSAVL